MMQNSAFVHPAIMMPPMMPPVMAPPKDNTFMLFGLVVLIVITILYFNNRTQTQISKLEKRMDIVPETETKPYAFITMAPQNKEFSIGLGDHIVFDISEIYSPNKDIVRLNGAYTTEYGKDCIGRYLLGTGTWKIIGNIGLIYFSEYTGFMNIAIVNADTGDPLSNSVNVAPLSSGSDSFSGSAFVTIFTLAKPTRIEVRFVSGMSHFDGIGWNYNIATNSQMKVPYTNMPSLIIEKK